MVKKVRNKNFITRQDGVITEVRCPICEEPVQKLAPVKTLNIHEFGKNKIVLYVTLAPTSNFAQATLQKDGIRVVVPVCQDCLSELDDDDMHFLMEAGAENAHSDKELLDKVKTKILDKSKKAELISTEKVTEHGLDHDEGSAPSSAI